MKTRARRDAPRKPALFGGFFSRIQNSIWAEFSCVELTNNFNFHAFFVLFVHILVFCDELRIFINFCFVMK